MPHLFTFDVARVDDDHDGNDDGWWVFPGSGSTPSADVAQADDDDNDTGDQMALDFGGV